MVNRLNMKIRIYTNQNIARFFIFLGFHLKIIIIEKILHKLPIFTDFSEKKL